MSEGERRPRVLLVEDNEPLRMALVLGLRRSGFDVEDAGDGAAALRILGSSTFDVLVTDLLMPERDGMEVILSARRMSPELRIIAMSGGGRFGPDAYLPTAKNFGAHAVLSKPFELDVLVSAIRATLAD